MPLCGKGPLCRKGRSCRTKWYVAMCWKTVWAVVSERVVVVMCRGEKFSEEGRGGSHCRVNSFV